MNSRIGLLIKKTFVLSLLAITACSSDKVPVSTYKAKNIVVVIMDGARYSETWGSADHSYIPCMDSAMSKQGVVYTAFENNGFTYTASGHVSITTGYNQQIDNTGNELPGEPSFFQLWLKETMNSPTKAWVIASKDKLEVLANCKWKLWKDQYKPSANCGVNGAGIGSGYRDDSLTMISALSILEMHQPRIVLINLREPDYSGHSGNWTAYINGLKKSDQYVYELWKFIQTHPAYKDKTAFFVTNDHGRHLDNVDIGFSAHGDDCEGCRHIFLYAYGPDFKTNTVISSPRSLIDLNATIQELLSLNARSTKGNVMTELFAK